MTRDTCRHIFCDSGVQFTAVLILVLMCGFIGCSPDPLARLEMPQHLTLYSIDGRDFEPGEEPTSEEKFHGYPVLGKVEITEESKRRDVIGVIKAGLENSDGKMASCFWPRHAVRMVRENETTEMVICFECYQLKDVSSKPGKSKAITRDAQPLFDKVLQDAGIKLAPKP